VDDTPIVCLLLTTAVKSRAVVWIVMYRVHERQMLQGVLLYTDGAQRLCILARMCPLSTCEHRAFGSAAVLCSVSGRLSFLCHFDLLKHCDLVPACTDSLCRLRAETAAVLFKGACL
jgi:hypothetical protein